MISIKLSSYVSLVLVVLVVVVVLCSINIVLIVLILVVVVVAVVVVFFVVVVVVVCDAFRLAGVSLAWNAGAQRFGHCPGRFFACGGSFRGVNVWGRPGEIPRKWEDFHV